VEKIFFSHDLSKLWWKVVLKNEPQGKWIENAKGNGPNFHMLTIGSGQDSLGLHAPLPQGN
jgi:hypothetical protein